MPNIFKFLLSAVLAQGTHSVKYVEPPTTRTFPLLEAIFNDELQNLKILLEKGEDPNRNFGVGTALDYAQMYGKDDAIKMLVKHGGLSGKTLKMSTVAMAYNPQSPRKIS